MQKQRERERERGFGVQMFVEGVNIWKVRSLDRNSPNAISCVALAQHSSKYRKILTAWLVFRKGEAKQETSFCFNIPHTRHDGR